MLVLTIYPLVLSKGDGKADHLATLLLLCAMSAGFVRGVGFVPKNRGLRVLFSTSVCVLALVLAVAVVVWRRFGQ
jgi:predicted membrane protein